MNTPSHTILNLALLTDTLSNPLTGSILVGAILPDLPIFTLYIWAKGIRRLPGQQIWSETYYSSFWQTWVNLFHSIPLAILGILIGHAYGWHALELLFGSALLHDLLDLPVHHDDAHKHFFPLHEFRFISPISYWDPRHHGQIVAGVEIMLVLLATLYLFPGIQNWAGSILLVAVNLFYGLTYSYAWIRRRQLACGTWQEF
jgi:hypothetical protein